MRRVTVLVAGSVWVLAGLVGTVVLIWTAAYVDNSAHPTVWPLGALVTLGPLGLWVVGRSVPGDWRSRLGEQGLGW